MYILRIHLQVCEKNKVIENVGLMVTEHKKKKKIQRCKHFIGQKKGRPWLKKYNFINFIKYLKLRTFVP